MLAKMKSIIFFVVVFSIINLSTSFALTSKYGEWFEGENLWVTIEKTNDKYSIERITTNKNLGKIDLNNLYPTFNISERPCGNYYVNGNPANDIAHNCELVKHTEFLSISVDTVSNVLFTAFTLGTNVLKGGVHSRTGNFDEEEYKKALNQVFNTSGVDRKKIINDYTYFVNEDKKRQNEYISNVKNLKYNYVINNETGFEHNINFNKYYIDVADVPSLSSIPQKMTLIEFNDKLNRKKVDELLQNKYSKINLKSKQLSVDGFDIEIEPSIVENRPNNNVAVKVNIKSKKFSSVYPNFENEDNFLTTRFINKMLNFTNKTDNFIQILSVSMYYGTYIKTLPLTSNPIELAPQATTLDPLSFSQFEDGRIRDFTEHYSITAEQAKSKNTNFGFAIKYRVVDQNVDKTQFKQNNYNLYEVLTGGYKKSNSADGSIVTSAGGLQAKPFKPIKRK